LPLVAGCSGITMYINAFDHPPPHVHVYQAEDEAMLNIRTLEIIEGELSVKAYRKVKKWMEKNQDNLIWRWTLAQIGEEFEPIEEC